MSQFYQYTLIEQSLPNKAYTMLSDHNTVFRFVRLWYIHANLMQDIQFK